MVAALRTARRLIAAMALTCLLATAGAVCAVAATPMATSVAGSSVAGTSVAGPVVLQVPVGPEPDGSAVSLDATLYLPTGDSPHPAVVLAHGFGGSKDDLSTRATRLAGAGFVVLNYTARGFGASGGRVHLNDPDVEVADAARMVDLLATRPEVALDAAGDPRVGVVGGSYGGALALMAAGADPRVDAVVASITWNDLSAALFPQAATLDQPGVAPGAPPLPAPPGPFAQLWASTLFTSVAESRGPTEEPGVCGRFDPALCAAFLPALSSGQPSPELLDLLHRHSPTGTNAKVTAPTLLIQGQSDSLFGLDQADENWRQLTQADTPVAMRWTDGGHDAPSESEPADEEASLVWLRHYLGDAPGTQLPVPAFSFAGATPRGAQTPPIHTLPSYPRLVGNHSLTLPFADPTARQLISPPGARPAATLATPGLRVGDSLGGDASTITDQVAYPLAALPGMHAAFDVGPLARGQQVVGSPQVRLRVTSTASPATLYVSLWQVSAGSARIAHRLSAPVQVPTTDGQPTEVTVWLPAGAWAMPAGSTWRVLVTSTDSSFATGVDARRYTVQPIGAGLQLPVVEGAETSGTGTDLESWGLVAAIAAVLVLAGALAAWRRRAGARDQPDGHHPDRHGPAGGGEPGDTGSGDRASAGVVLSVEHLVKTYRDGHRAVDDVSFEVRRGQVVGLLGPNGAGKTTTLRMVMGLIRPTAGRVRVLGRVVRPGSPVLAEVGALVEGPGFLPHLTGRANLQAYWAATGRPPGEARLEDALEVAALGGAVDRPVRSYSQGMRQRLGIAQAMLGLPDVLILDEPTNGLDPPQIAAMRPVLRAYAATGRTVIVSSHLLAEVEMTCTDVVVMDRGHVIVTGSVADLTAATDEHGRRRLEEVFLGVLSASHGDPGDWREHGRRLRRRPATAGALAMTTPTPPPTQRATLQRRALPWRAELGRQLHRRRTYWASGLTLVLPIVIVAAFALGDDSSGGTRFVDLARTGSANFAVFVLYVSAQLLLLIVATLFTGDPVPSEASWGSLRYLLTAPVSRPRLLTAKLVVGLASSLVIVVVLPFWSLLVGGVAYGWAAFTPPTGGTLTWPDLVPRLLVTAGYIFVALAPCAMLAFWLGVLTDAPLAAVGGAVLASIVFGILDALDTLGDLRRALPLHYLDSWVTVLSADPDWVSLRHGALWSLLWSMIFGVGAYWTFTRKDVLS